VLNPGSDMKGRNEAIAIGNEDALIVVDVQRDFLPGGALAVPSGDAVIAPLNSCVESFSGAARPVFYSRDWHPQNHCSFREQGGPWPPHCIAGSPGAEFAAGLRIADGAVILSKATRADRDAYSAFQGTDLAVQLRNAGVRRVFVCGLATDYCVRATVLEARENGFEVTVVTDAVRAVDLHPGDGDRAFDEMRARGASLARSTELARDGESR